MYLGFHYFDHKIYKQKDFNIVYNIVASNDHLVSNLIGLNGNLFGIYHLSHVSNSIAQVAISLDNHRSYRLHKQTIDKQCGFSVGVFLSFGLSLLNLC